MIFIDYMTISLSSHISRTVLTTFEVLLIFARILPTHYRNTCKDAIFSNGVTERVTQYGISVSKQYGTGSDIGWLYSIQLSGDYLHAIERDVNMIKQILSQFENYRLSRLDLARDVCILIEEWQNYYHFAFISGKNVVGTNDARTVYYGARTSQFYTRVYNKTAQDKKHYPATDGHIIIRFEVEIKRIRNEQVLEHAFDSDFMNRLFLQRVRTTALSDDTNMIKKYFDYDDVEFEKITTVKRVVGNLEKTVIYILNTFGHYFIAGFHNPAVHEKLKNGDVQNNVKVKKILTVLDSILSNDERGENEK